MELQKTSSTKSMSKILKFLPRATSSVSFHNPSTYSPAKDRKSLEKLHKSNFGIGFSITIISPNNDLRKSKNNSTSKLVFEPTSPRVSCMGQVKCKHYRKLVGANKKPLPITQKPISRTTSFTPLRIYNNEDYQEQIDSVAVKTKKKSRFRSIFSGSSRKKCDNINDKPESNVMMNFSKVPSLSTMNKFSSGRDAFSNFDWTTQVVPLDNTHHNCGSESEVDEEITVPSSPPMMMRNKGFCDDFIRVGGVKSEPKNEVNLWRRRTMAQPKPLQLHVAA